MDPALFAADLAAKPSVLAELADHLEAHDVWDVLPLDVRRVIFVGMGSSAYAASVVAARLRAKGVNAIAELASSALLPLAQDGDVVIAISAGGGSRETVAAVQHYSGSIPVFLLTNTPATALAEQTDGVVELRAGDEVGGVACRSYQHTLALLLSLEARLTSSGLDVAELVRRSATAGADLLQRADTWVPQLIKAFDGPDGIHIVAPAHRFSSAQQSALMLREGPRVMAVACETGDWSHVDVYLTKSTDYRLLLLAGSAWEAELLTWVEQRGSTLVSVGAATPGAQQTLRYAHDDDDDVRLLTEVLVCELLASALWSAQ